MVRQSPPVAHASACDSLRESLDGLQGTVSPDGRFTAANDRSASTGLVKATVEGVTGVARIRVIPALPWDDGIDARKPRPPPAHWVGAMDKFQVPEMNGNQALVKSTPATIVLGVALLLPTGGADPPQEDWLQFRGIRQLTGVAHAALRDNLKLLLLYEAGACTGDSPALVAGGGGGDGAPGPAPAETQPFPALLAGQQAFLLGRVSGSDYMTLRNAPTVGQSQA